MDNMKQEIAEQKGTNRANLSLGGTTKNFTPQIYETHPTLKQHKIHIKKAFIYQKVT
jgi:hypothetical protein